SAVSAQPPPPPATYPLSLHDALPIYPSLTRPIAPPQHDDVQVGCRLGWKTEQYVRSHDDGAHGRAVRSSVGLPESQGHEPGHATDRKSTRLNSSHVKISYAVFCLKKK